MPATETTDVLLLERYAYLPDRVSGILHLPNGQRFHTIERPWMPDEVHAGGTPSKSCVPDGLYQLEPFTRPSGREVIMLSNPDLGVDRYETDRPGQARYLVLIHAGNYAHDVEGCIAPGYDFSLAGDFPMVTNSRLAMREIMKAYNAGDFDELLIRPQGASDEN